MNLTSFVRKTTKYWVHADNITDVKCIILQNLPVLVFKQDKRFERGYDAAITSIYFDNENLDVCERGAWWGMLELYLRRVSRRFSRFWCLSRHTRVSRKHHGVLPIL